MKPSYVLEPTVYNFIKKRLLHQCFPVNFVKFFRTSFFAEHIQAIAFAYFVWQVCWNIHAKATTYLGRIILLKGIPQNTTYTIQHVSRTVTNPFFIYPLSLLIRLLVAYQIFQTIYWCFPRIILLAKLCKIVMYLFQSTTILQLAKGTGWIRKSSIKKRKKITEFHSNNGSNESHTLW